LPCLSRVRCYNDSDKVWYLCQAFFRHVSHLLGCLALTALFYVVPNRTPSMLCDELSQLLL